MLKTDTHLFGYLLQKIEIDDLMLLKVIDEILGEKSKVSGGNIQWSRAVSQVLHEAQQEAKKLNDQYVTLEHLLLAILKNKIRYRSY